MHHGKRKDVLMVLEKKGKEKHSSIKQHETAGNEKKKQGKKGRSLAGNIWNGGKGMQ